MIGDFLDRIVTRYKRGTLFSHYRDTFNTPNGRVVLADLFNKAGVMKTMAGFDNAQIQYATGGRDVVLYIAAMLRIRDADLQQYAEISALDNERED